VGWDRFSRNTGDAYYMIRTLQGYGISPQAVEQPLELSVPENKMTGFLSGNTGSGK
jgi:site-specific DNA recombinase